MENTTVIFAGVIPNAAFTHLDDQLGDIETQAGAFGC
jgi:hypothetical protein